MHNRHDRSTIIPKVPFSLFNLRENNVGTRYPTYFAQVLQPCSLAAVACMWPVWGDITVQVLTDRKHAR